MAALAHEEGCCIDVSTGGELAVALAAGVPAERLVLHGNNKSVAELEAALEAGVGRIVVDSFDEIDRLALLSGRSGPDGPLPSVLVRVTPGDRGSHTRVRDDGTGRLEVRVSGWPRAPRQKRSAGSGTRPAECAWSACTRTSGPRFSPWRASSAPWRLLVPFFSDLDLDELCIGGGLGVPYIGGETAPSISEWAETLRTRQRQTAGHRRPMSCVSAEPGRSIVAAAAITCYTVGTIKTLPGLRTYVSVDGGMSDNPRPVLYGSGYEAFLPREVAARRPWWRQWSGNTANRETSSSATPACPKI